MFCKDVQKRLELLNKSLITISREQIHLTEKKKEGTADLQLQLYHPCILFHDLEKRKLQFFKNQKCSDYVMFEYAQDQNQWLVHIFELKRSVGESEWTHLKAQFMGALQNALALAGVLNITFNLNDVYVYTVFRNDKLNNHANTTKQRLKMYERNNPEYLASHDWNEEKIILDFLGEHKFEHQKIKLDIETGKASFQLHNF